MPGATTSIPSWVWAMPTTGTRPPLPTSPRAATPPSLTTSSPTLSCSRLAGTTAWSWATTATSIPWAPTPAARVSWVLWVTAA